MGMSGDTHMAQELAGILILSWKPAMLKTCYGRVTACYSALQRVTGVLQRVTACYSVLWACYSVLQACYRVLQRVTGVLQRVFWHPHFVLETSHAVTRP